MESAFADFWAAGIERSGRRDAHVAAAAASAVNIRKFSVSALRDLAVDRGVSPLSITHDSAELVARIEAHTASVRATPAARAQLGGWLSGHTAFREYGSELEQEAYQLLTAFGAGDDPLVSAAIAGARVRRLGAGVRKLAASVHAHGSWEEEVIFGFLKRELRSFAPFYDALTGEHAGAADLASEVSLPALLEPLPLHVRRLLC
jgi:hypothetical protein